MVPVASSVTVAGTRSDEHTAELQSRPEVVCRLLLELLNVAVTVVLGTTPVALGVGAWAITVGAVSVVKLHAESVPSVVPVTSATVPATGAEETVASDGGADGVRAAM